MRVPDLKRSRSRLKFATQSTISRVGAHCSAETIRRLDRAVSYLEVGWWMRANGFDTSNRVRHRNELFNLVANEVGDREVLYLEFGVHRGLTMRYWSRILRNPQAQLHGFDSFEGLPEDWDLRRLKGHFSTGGEMPVIEDARVRFFKGWFEETLPRYEWPEHECLVVNMDANLYSSTQCALSFVRPKLVPGSFLYFDEFMDRASERRAFEEFSKETGWRFRCRGLTGNFVSVLLQRTD